MPEQQKMGDVLEALAVKCEQAAEGSFKLDDAIYEAVFCGEQDAASFAEYSRSLDAAMLLAGDEWDHMEVYRPDHQDLGWTVHLLPNANRGSVGFAGFARTHALALCAAALRARSAQSGDILREGQRS